MQSFILWVTAGGVLLLLVELFAGRHKGIYKSHDLPLFVLSFTLGRFIMGPAAALLVAFLYGLALPQYHGALAGTSFWLAFPVLLLFEEFCFYWVHRWAHNTSTARFPVLWKIHRTHHSAPYMNVSLFFGRLNLFWYVIIPSAWTLGLGIHLGLGEAAAAVIITLSVWNIITHSHFRWDDPIRRHRIFGPVFRALEHVFVSPGIHHTHHGYGRDGASYRNFATVISLYDWMFGTLHIPDGRPSRYGLPGHEVYWVEELLYPLVQRRTK